MICAARYVTLLLLYGLVGFAQDAQTTAAQNVSTGPASATISAVPAEPQARKIHVIVVAVPTYKIQSYNSDELKAAFADRCEEVKTFFQDHLGADNVDVLQYCSEQKTTRESLRHLFSIDVPSLSARTVTLIFIMSHGEQVSFKNGFLSSDVELITSDTEQTDDGDSDGKRRFTSILVGSELLTWLTTAPTGSTVLTFLDTCHSGAVGSLSTSLAQFMSQKHGGLRSLVVSSSLPKAATYKAYFTKDLLELWNSGTAAAPGCINLDTMPDDIYKQMKVQAPLDPGEGTPEVVIKYQGPLCLGNFGKDRKLLFVYAGQDTERDPYQYEVRQVTATGASVVIPEQPLRFAFYPIPLDSGQYSIRVSRHNQLTGTWDVDLSAASTRVIWLDDNASPAAFGTAAENIAQTAQNEGLPSEDVIKLRARAVAVYRAAGMNDDAKRLEAALPKDAQNAVLPPPRIPIPSDLKSAFALASQLTLSGNFKSAGAVLERAADSQRSDPAHDEVAKQAYFAFIAAGDAKSASNVRKNFNLDDDSLKPVERLAAKGGAAGSGAKTLGLAESLGDLTSISAAVK